MFKVGDKVKFTDEHESPREGIYPPSGAICTIVRVSGRIVYIKEYSRTLYNAGYTSTRFVLAKNTMPINYKGDIRGKNF